MHRFLFGVTAFLCLFSLSFSCGFVPQTNETDLVYKVRMPATKGGNAPLLILLHGVGSDEDDLFSLAPQLPADFVVVSARAPITLNIGSYAWFKIDRSTGTLVYDIKEVEKSRAILEQFIANMVKKYHANPDKVFLMGFSQGAIMSYCVALNKPQLVRGVVALSGRMLAETKQQVKISAAHKKLNLFIGHGASDRVLPVNDGRSASAFLESKGLKVTYKEYPMQHQIVEDELVDVVTWLKAVH